jgi:hypothetical protein
MNKHITQSIVVSAVVSAVMLMVNVVPGAVFIQIVQSQLDKFGEMKFESLSGASARKIVLVIGIMSAHALGEGCGVGVSFCGNRGWAQVTTHPQQICHITEA